MSDTKRPRGPAGHKNPDCPCKPCVSRRRQAQAIAHGNRAEVDAALAKGAKRLETPAIREGAVEEVINADVPALKRHTMKDRVLHFVEMRLLDPSLTIKEASKRMGLSERTLYGYIHIATREGWLKWDDAIDRIDHEIIPKTLDNIAEFLDQKDRTVTIEVAKGTIFKQYQEAKGIADSGLNAMGLRIEVVMPDVGGPVITSSAMVGKPKAFAAAKSAASIGDLSGETIDAEVVES